jgi:Na+/glutamate symporter
MAVRAILFYLLFFSFLCLHLLLLLLLCHSLYICKFLFNYLDLHFPHFFCKILGAVMLANLEARKQEKMDALKKLKEELAIKRQLAQRGIQREELSPEALQALMKDLEEQRRARREAREQKMMAKGTHHFFFPNPLCVCVCVGAGAGACVAW